VSFTKGGLEVVMTLSLPDAGLDVKNGEDEWAVVNSAVPPPLFLPPRQSQASRVTFRVSAVHGLCGWVHPAGVPRTWTTARYGVFRHVFTPAPVT